jgi:excinuclease ABC subunit C
MTKEENKKRLEYLKQKVASLPEGPGCYQYLDEKGTIIYVGKAKNLKRRVSSYFRLEVDRYKTKVLVSKIYDLIYIRVNSDEDAFLLENNLIKEHKPKYNVLLKDSKTYPSICVTNEIYPRIFKTRNIQKKSGTYYGPYSHLGPMYAVLELVKKLYQPRLCNYPMTEEGIRTGKYRSCLEYHIHNCKAPCIGKQSHEEYMNNIAEAKEILSGKTREVCKKLYEKMQELASELKFEEAEEVKKRYLLIDNYCSKSEVVSNTINNVDVFSITDDTSVAFINYLHVTNGAINQAYNFEYKKRLNETPKELLQMGIIEMRERYKSSSKEIIVPFEMDMNLNGITFTIPQRGDKKTLLDLSLMNGKQYKFDRLKQAEKLNPEQKNVRLMKEIQDTLKLPKMPYTIESFDNSNISGTDAVAACVVFKQLKPSKKDYRTYNIKTVVGPDDYASMKEVVRRRYHRLIEEKQTLPDLIITDGGKGQMEVVREVIEDELGLNIPIAGLAKNEHHRTNELLFGNPPVIVGMKTDSEMFRLMTRIQDEVHRFAIAFHRNKRSKHALKSELDDIKGIGEKTKTELLKKLKSVKQIKVSDIQELTEIIGKSKGQLVYNYFHENQKIEEI